jgi:ubiquinone/menaquinone biosynthesis C-methylase UbiE
LGMVTLDCGIWNFICITADLVRSIVGKYSMKTKGTEYYDATASKYEDLHGGSQDPEHLRALELGWPIIESLAPRTLLDVGCGTGRSLQWVCERSPLVMLVGVDPSRRLLELARANVPSAKLTLGDGKRLAFADRAFDVVIASGIMHHVDHPPLVIGEMFRVANKAVLISDHNNFAFGSAIAQRIRMLLHCIGLLKSASFIKQGFKKQGYSDGDGWWYPYSLLDNFAQISLLSERLHILPTRKPNTDFGGNIVFSQSHLAILGIKRETHD